MAQALSHYARLAGLQLVLWLDGVAVLGADGRFETIKKETKQGTAFAWFAPSNKNIGNQRPWRGFKVPFDDLPNGLATTVEISVGLDGERVNIPLETVPSPATRNGKVVPPRVRGDVDLLLGDDEMVAHCTLVKHTLKPNGDKRLHPFMTVTPRVTRRNATREEVAVETDWKGGSES